jgi:tRNA-dihydrouridine synthase B
MVGRGAMGNPFLFSQINEYLKSGTYKQFSFRDRLASFFTYYDYAKNYRIGLHQIKSQAIRFTKGCTGGKKIRGKLALSKTIDELLAVMNDSYSKTD